MHTHTAFRVRETPGPYGPYDAGFRSDPAIAVLGDLVRAPDHAVPAILARYAALRSRVLRDDRAHPALVQHAAQAARSYLAVVEDAVETRALVRLAAPHTPLSALWEAGVEAAGAGHVDGAEALLKAGYLSARRRREYRWAATMAAALATLLDEQAEAAEQDEMARLWARRSRQLQELAARGGPGG